MASRTEYSPTSARGVAGLFTNLRIGPKIIIGYFVLVVLLAGVAAVGYWGLQRVTSQADLAEERLADLVALGDMQYHAAVKYQYQVHYLFHGEEEALDEFQDESDLMDEAKAIARNAIDSDQELEWFAELDQVDQQFNELFLEGIVSAVQAGDEELAHTLDEQTDALLMQIADLSQKLAAAFQNEADDAQQSATEAHGQTLQLMVVFSVIAAAAGMIFGIVISQSISAPVQQVTQVATQLAQGDVDQQLTVYSQDEVGEMATAFRQMIDYQQNMAAAATNLALGDVSADITPLSEKDTLGNSFRRMINYQREIAKAADSMAQGDLRVDVRPQAEKDILGSAFAQMIANLRALIGQVADNANQVSVASEQLTAAANQSGQATAQVANTIQQVAQGIAQQTESMNRTTTSVDQMVRAIDSVTKGSQEQASAVAKSVEITGQISGTIQQVTANAQSGAQGSAKAAEVARGGAQMMEETIKGIEGIQVKVDYSAQKVREMGTRSEQISAIVDTIDDIASQTNLLALNAAIEAARAGEHGKGFAVVADAVRELAEKSAESTKEIADLIKGVQATVTEAIKAMDEGTAEVTAGVTRANQAGQSLASILIATEDVNQQVDEIASAAEQMDALANELVSAMDAVSAVVEENTAATEEMADGSDQVTQSIENIAGISEENSASAEEVSATVEEVNAQVEEVTASASSLSEMAQNLQMLVAQFTLPSTEKFKPQPAVRAPAVPTSTVFGDGDGFRN